MKKGIKIITILLIIIFTFYFDVVQGAETDNYYVNDYANILTKANTHYINTKSKDLYKKREIQIVVVTANNLEKLSIEDKSNTIFLVALLEEKEFRIEVGEGLKEIISDDKINEIKNEIIIPNLKEDNWNEVIKNSYDEIYSEVIHYFDETNSTKKESVSYGWYILVGICSFIIGIILRYILNFILSFYVQIGLYILVAILSIYLLTINNDWITFSVGGYLIGFFIFEVVSGHFRGKRIR